MKKICFLLVALSLTSQIAAADSDPCVKNYKVEGSFFTEKKYSTWQDFPKVEAKIAFKPAFAYTVKAGWTINQADKELGVISASRKVGQTGSETLNIIIEGNGGGSKVTTTRTESMGVVATKKEIQTEFCQIMADIAKAAESK